MALDTFLLMYIRVVNIPCRFLKERPMKIFSDDFMLPKSQIWYPLEKIAITFDAISIANAIALIRSIIHTIM